MQNLNIINNKLKDLAKKNNLTLDKYFLPEIWTNPQSISNKIVEVEPLSFYSLFITDIENLNKLNAAEYPFVYNLFIRFATTFDHAQDKKIENFEGQFRETGTFLKAILLLKYIKFFGYNHIYLLPVNTIGVHNRKGNAGSPYAVKNLKEFDEMLSEPILDIDPSIQYKAFIEACHLLNIKVVQEFPLRIASIDSDLSLEHPDWFYWIKPKKGNSKITDPNTLEKPYFNISTMKLIKEKVLNEDFTELPEPDENYKSKFSEVPKKVARVEDVIIGVDQHQKPVYIPSAFADWPPDDNQPAWDDVTYFKIYESVKFNYLAYNTIRMYDTKLLHSHHHNTELWDYIKSIIPYYIKEYGIDGAMIDMGHAFPKKLMKDIIAVSRKEKKDFIFWEEKFDLDANSSKDGYDAALGYCFFVEHQPNKVKEIISRFENNDIPIDFFLTPENHNSPRASSRFDNPKYNLCIYAINSFLPSILMVHNGYELAERYPVNLGLDFTDEEKEKYDSKKLALFNIASLDWTDNSDILKDFYSITQIRQSINLETKEIKLIESGNDSIVIFERIGIQNNKIIIAANISNEAISEINFHFNSEEYPKISLLNNDNSDRISFENNKLTLNFEAFGYFILDLVK